MLSTRYSGRDFDPYGDAEPEPDDDPWPAPTARSGVDAVVALPGSKSLTNRELVLAALADSPAGDASSLLRAPLHSQDSIHMISALRALGARIDELPAVGPFGADLRVTPGELLGSTTVDCGQAGTVMRFVPPVAALALGPTTFDADASARGRPMTSMIDALRSLGVDVADEGRGSMPFTIHGTGRVEGGEVTIDASRSSQFVSGLLLSAPRFERGLVLHHDGPRLPSIPHIEMTIATLAARGVRVESPSLGTWVVEPQPIRGLEVAIEPDLSNAAPFLAAALSAGGRVTVPGWPALTTQVGAELRTLLAQFGASVSFDETVGPAGTGALTVESDGTIHGVALDLTIGGELAPVVVALAALADSPSEIIGIGHIRHHETDRLAALANEINGLGGAVTELEDGLRIEPRPLHGGLWRSYEDHRMAHAGAVIGLRVPGVEIDDIGVTAKTLPQFPELWRAMLAGRPTV